MLQPLLGPLINTLNINPIVPMTDVVTTLDDSDEDKLKKYKLEQNKEAYIQSRKKEGAVDYSDGVISQYGFGSTMKPGSYDRYTPFENYPEADFLVTGMHLGMVQASCNPYKNSFCKNR
jgi:hypothetical protein